MPHPDEGLIHAWLDGELDAAEAARVEALVAGHPEWAAAAAEARGLIAASSRIVGTLDHVHANVIPKRAPARRAPRWWMARVAALLVVVAGTTLVLRQDDVPHVLPASAQTNAQAPALDAVKTPPAEAPRRAGSVASGSVAPGSGVAVPRPSEPTPPARDQKAAALAGAASGPPAAPADSLSVAPRERSLKDEPRQAAQAATALGAAAERQKVTANLAVPAAVAPKPQIADRADAGVIVTGVRVGGRVAAGVACFAVRGDTARAGRLWKLDSAQVADSTRLLKLTVHGDTLRGASSSLVAIRVRCPEP